MNVAGAHRWSVVVPYPASNSSVRTRALHWIERVRGDAGEPSVYGPGFRRGRPEPGGTVLLVRNRRRVTWGGAERSVLARASLAVYDLDDGLPFDNGRLPGLGSPLKAMFPRSRVARRSAQAADRVIVGNELLAEWARGHCGDVRIVPTCVEPSDYRRREAGPPSGPPLLGWIGSPATEHFLWDLQDVLVDLHRRLGIRVEVVSGAGEVPSALRSFVVRIPWGLEVQHQRLAAWDVGLAPLRDGVYERAKCGYKLLQYASAGLPVVGSPVGVNADILRSLDGEAAVSTDDWLGAIDRLVHDGDQRWAQRRAAGLATADAYSYDRWEPVWRAALDLPVAP